MNQSLILIRGIPGSGKSTLAKALQAAIPNSVHLEADMYFVHNGEYSFVPSKIADAHRSCQLQARENLKAGKTVIVANTFTQLWEMQAYIDMLYSTAIPLQIIICKGAFANIHGVPPEKVNQMAARFEYS